MRFIQVIVLLGILSISSSLVNAADGPGARHGAIPAKPDGLAVEAGTTITYQHANDSRGDDEWLASVDIVAVMPTPKGQWLLYVEGNTSPKQDGVTNLWPEANDDAGSALDHDGKGRLQVSALHYLHDLGNDALVVGLIDPAGPLDNSDIANNETSQFIGSTLVNNPTIAFPDYTLGAVYFFKPDQSAFDFTFMLTSSHGLADNPNASYSELFDVGETGKGVFAAGEIVWKGERHTWRSGLWLQTADNDYVDGSGQTGNNYGLYLSSDHLIGLHRLNVRAGLANDKVSDAAGFIGLAVDHALGRNHAGIGYTRTFVSGKASANMDDMSQFELFYRYAATEDLTITPSVQRIQNSFFDTSSATRDSDVRIISVRANYTY